MNLRAQFRLLSSRCVNWLALFTFCLTATSITALGQEPKKSELVQKQTVLITGANRGLGLEYAKGYREAGHTVIGTARDPEEAADLKATGAEVMKLDITRDEQIATLAKDLKGRKIDILINNAGYFPRKKTREEMLLAYSINTVGPLLLSQALVPNLKLSESPKIINISSGVAQLTDGSGQSGGYAFSKTALNMVTRKLHSSLHKDGVIVISLDPGHNQTDMGGKGAPLKPEETSIAILSLIESLKPEQSGEFWRYDGTCLSW